MIPLGRDYGANLNHLEVIYVHQDAVINYLTANPTALRHKKFHELLVGWILAQFLGKAQRETMYVGFPMKPVKPDLPPFNQTTKRSIDWLLRNHDKVVDDSDTDICVGNQKLYTKFQVVRFFYPKGTCPLRRLADLIAKKCEKYDKDPKLFLVVSIENRCSISQEELINLCTKVIVPFGGIFLVMKASNQRGHFTCCSVYPKVVVGKEVHVPLPV